MKKITHPDFAKRIERACDGNPDVPPLNHGRLGWFVEQLDKHAVEVTQETVRKWFHGETRPRHKAMTALAQILKVDEGWFSSGKSPEFSETQRKQNNVVAGGAVNAVAGFIQMDGGHPAFPMEEDREAESKKIHLYAIIRGAKYSFHISPALGEGDGRHFLVPHEAEGTIVLGIIRDGPFSVRILELDWDTIRAAGTRKSTGFDVPLDGRQWREITSFAERI
ncbi:hypothetical protein [Mesorhizobium sp. M0859]|uniref:hypothetical protein n=1 Tax=Mesorhizobium sp. M0859 TaxID=2957014 RepID=UPI0033387D33